MLMRYSPVQELQKGLEVLNAIMHNLEGTNEERNLVAFVPAVNTREDEKAYYIEVDLPGVKKEDIDITTEDNVLTISGERKVRQEVKEDDYYKVESRYGKFSRSFNLPEDADVEKIEAHAENGVLEIVIPKKAEVTKVKKIAVK